MPQKLLSETIRELREDLSFNHNECLLGILLHNMAVIQLLAGKGKESIKFFQEAVAVKSSAFGENSLEVAVSYKTKNTKSQMSTSTNTSAIF